MSKFFVRRMNDERIGYVGPLPCEHGAKMEADAWISCGWEAEVLPNIPEVREQVREWEAVGGVITRLGYCAELQAAIAAESWRVAVRG